MPNSEKEICLTSWISTEEQEKGVLWENHGNLALGGRPPNLLVKVLRVREGSVGVIITNTLHDRGQLNKTELLSICKSQF